MINSRELTLHELDEIGLRALRKALGPVGTARFLRQLGRGGRDYTRDRDEILATVTEANLEADLKKVRREIMRDPAPRSKGATPGKRREPSSRSRRKARARSRQDRAADAVRQCVKMVGNPRN